MKPYKYQLAGLDAIDKFGGRALLYAKPGAGKTAMSCWSARRRVRPPIVVVCPAPVKYVWEEAAAEILKCTPYVCKSRTPKALPPAKAYICNYDILKAWKRELRLRNPRLLVIDECHFLKGRTTQRTKAVRYFLRYCGDTLEILALSGTPITKNPIDLWPILKILRPDVFESFKLFADDFCNKRNNGFGVIYDGARNHRELKRLLRQTCVVPCKMDENQLPKRIRQVVPLEMEREADYWKAERNFIEWLKSISPRKALNALAAPGLRRTAELRQLSAKLKLPSAVKWIENFLAESDEKLLIFGWHVDVVAKLAESLKTPLVITGAVGERLRLERIRAFASDPKERILIGNAAIGTGVDGLQHAASHAAIVEFPWLPAELLQWEGRLRRVGQTAAKTHFNYLVAHGTVEERMLKILRRRQEDIERIMDDDVIGDFDVFEELLTGLGVKL